MVTHKELMQKLRAERNKLRKAAAAKKKVEAKKKAAFLEEKRLRDEITKLKAQNRKSFLGIHKKAKTKQAKNKIKKFAVAFKKGFDKLAGEKSAEEALKDFERLF